jgi:hypothetical protein
MLIVVFVYSSAVLPRAGLTWFDYFLSLKNMYCCCVIQHQILTLCVCGLHILIQARGETR